jgi:alkyl hydroperoxide reductase subunit AhpF
MLDEGSKAQLNDCLGRIAHPIALVASVDGSEASREMIALLQVGGNPPKLDAGIGERVTLP